MSAVVLIVGEGILMDYVCEKLSSKYTVIRQIDFTTGVPEILDLAMVLHDTWQPSVHLKAEEVLQAAGVPWLRGFVSFGEGVIGPLVRPGVQGCSQCADMRLLMARRDRKEMWEIQRQIAADEGIPRDVWASRTGLLQMAHLLAAEAQRILQGSKAHLEERVFLLNLKMLKGSRHFFLPDPTCPVCGRLPDDSANAAQISLQPNPKFRTDVYRCRPMNDLKEVLVKDYLDNRTGFLNGKVYDLESPFATVGMNLPLTIGDEATAGRTLSFAESELTAILEGIERHGGLAAQGKRTVVYDSFRNLGDQALNPLAVGVHAQEQYARPDFPFQSFDPDRQIHWVWGYSFMQERPILVPELLAYYSLGCGEGFVYETSNGCALGGSLEEAIFHGILEVVERDSFLMTWYAQLPLPRLDPYSAKDRELRLMIDHLRAVTSFELYMFNATMENGIPSVWVLAKNRRKQGVNLICAAGAHVDPVRAVKGAIHELAGMLLTFNKKFEANREKYVRMFYDPFEVKQMDDHSMLYSLPQAEERLQFLLNDDRPLRTFAEEFKQQWKHADLTDDLKDILQVFRSLNLDVIVVDQTTPEMKRNRLHCVKVLIPGMLPMTFGHHLTRLEGLERVLNIPMELGYTPQPLTPEQLNPHPHPFP
ncbi:TOMM precursor leader peptide-binding protein [Fodinisporobacter ferrooxydans]|uniref:TOMM leader peptide-binding protein n=1 Tax=Fodinisporobacter ferrooxydans TaxID=2901836 RepID=A0ABY4CGC9_9BACL|nr:TOMM precursor leader peptide-binding protein [Alicyclobacillaceae bacterium MYW30-H2]